MQVKRCVNCMEEIEDDLCPRCGCDNANLTEQSPVALKYNTVLHGRYLVGRMLGQGGFGITYIGFDLLLNIKVAIKEYFPMGTVSRDNSVSNLLRWSTSMGQEEQWKAGCESFLKEARKMAKIDSIPGIVRVRDTFYENQTAYIVMDYIEGITLKQHLLQNGPMLYSDCIRMLAPLMSSLGKVHEQGLIHRDISPDNIMIQQDWSMKLLDLGAAKDMSGNKEGASQLVTKRGFSPAEQYMEQGVVGSWTDVYAFCATMYYCIYGKVIPDAMERMMDDQLIFPPLADGRTVPEDIVETLRAGLSIRTEGRIQTMEELLTRLAAYIGTGDSDILNAIEKFSKTQDFSGKKKKKKNRKKVSKKVVIPVVCALVCAIAAVVLVIVRPWRLKVEKLGNSNSNILNDGGMLMLDQEYEYFLDHNNNLCVCKFDETNNCYYVDSAEIVAEDAYYINEGTDAIYFAANVKDHAGLYKMNYDGSNIECLCDNLNQLMLMQYVRFTNGSEYLYFVEMLTETEVSSLRRYNISEDKVEIVIDEDICWYNLYGDSLYYTLYDDENTTVFYKSDPDGKHEKVLDSENIYSYGFVEDDTIYLYSHKENTIAALDLDGKVKRTIYDAKMNIDNFTFAYGDGWLYYVGADDGGLYHIREDGSGNSKIVNGIYFVSICVCSDDLWLLEGAYEGEELLTRRVYMAYKDGTGIFEADNADIFKTQNGLLYKKEGDNITICGYEGLEKDVGIPYVIDGLYVTNIEEGSLQDDVNFYLYAEDDKLEYTLTDDENSLVITGYTGDLTKIMLPDAIDGKNVVGIGERAFEGSALEMIVLGKYVKTINDYAFQDCESLRYVKLSEELNRIGVSAFDGCASLTEIEIPNKVTELDKYCFYDTQVTQLKIPAQVNYIGPKIATNIADGGYSIDSLNSTYVDVNGVIYTKDMKTLVSCPDQAQGAFVIPAKVETVYEYAFFDCDGITEISLEDGSILQTVEDGAFEFCDSLTMLDLSKSGKTIGNHAIYYNDNLTTVLFPYEMTCVTSSVIGECNRIQQVVIREDCDFQAEIGNGVEILYYEVESDEN